MVSNVPVAHYEDSSAIVGSFHSDHFESIFAALGFFKEQNFTTKQPFVVCELEARFSQSLAAFVAGLERHGAGKLQDLFQWKGCLQSTAEDRRELVQQTVAMARETLVPVSIEAVGDVWSACAASLKKIERNFADKLAELNFDGGVRYSSCALQS